MIIVASNVHSYLLFYSIISKKVSLHDHKTKLPKAYLAAVVKSEKDQLLK